MEEVKPSSRMEEGHPSGCPGPSNTDLQIMFLEWLFCSIPSVLNYTCLTFLGTFILLLFSIYIYMHIKKFVYINGTLEYVTILDSKFGSEAKCPNIHRFPS
jgi:hypothetical protein